MRRNTICYLSIFLSFVVLLCLTGCSTHTAALDNARTSVAQARANTLVAANAPVTLHEAEQSLARAEKADNDQEQRHYAYLAQRQSEQAVYEANQKAAQQGIARSAEERQQVLLQSREQQAAQARMQAQTAEQQARMAEQRAMSAEQRAQTAQQQQAMAAGQAEAYRQQAELAAEQSSQLQSRLSELQARQTNQGNVQLTLSDVMFATNQAVLQPGAVTSLNKLADILKQNPNEKVYIEGHTDNRGAAAYNQQLSQARADAVRQALVQAGVSPDRIVARGMGESFPVASNDTQAGRQLNRRVDIVVTG